MNFILLSSSLRKSLTYCSPHRILLMRNPLNFGLTNFRAICQYYNAHYRSPCNVLGYLRVAQRRANKLSSTCLNCCLLLVLCFIESRRSLLRSLNCAITSSWVKEKPKDYPVLAVAFLYPFVPPFLHTFFHFHRHRFHLLRCRLLFLLIYCPPAVLQKLSSGLQQCFFLPLICGKVNRDFSSLFSFPATLTPP
jgi:hypothetical protein